MNLGLIKFTPSFAPGYYNYWRWKDLGSPLEFKSEVQMSLIYQKALNLACLIIIYLMLVLEIKILEQIVICLIFLNNFNLIKLNQKLIIKMNLKDCHNFEDFRKLAKKKLPSPIFHYIDGGSDDEITLRRNTESFNDCDLVPNVLQA